MEQTDTCEGHSHAVLIAALDDSVVSDRSARLGDVLDAALLCALDVIGEREESVGSESDIMSLIEPCALLFRCEDFRLHLEDLLPCAVSQNIHILLTDVNVDRVVAVSTANIVDERKLEYLRALAEQPVVSLVACETYAVDAGLLSCTDTDRLTIVSIAYRVGLCILQSDQGDHKVTLCGFREIFVGGDYICKNVIVDDKLVASLFKCDTENILVLKRFRHIFRIDIDGVVVYVPPGAITPPETSRLMILAVEASHTSDREMKSPKELMRSAPRALAYAHASGESSSISSTK